MKRLAKPTLTKALKAAGIVAIGSRNLNGSYTCQVQLCKIDVTCNTTNYRKYDLKHMKALNADFDPMALRNPILFFRRNRRTLPTMDGRHTVNLLRWRMEEGHDPKGEWDIIECDVYLSIKDHESAAVFYRLTQNSKRMDPWSAFFSAYKARFPFAVAMHRLFRDYEFSTPVDDGPPPRKGADLSSVEPFLEAWRLTEDASMVESLLYILYEAFVYDSSLATTAGQCSFIRGLIDLLRRYEEEYDLDYIVKRLKRNEPDDYKGMASAIASDERKRLDRRHYRMAFERALLGERAVRIAA